MSRPHFRRLRRPVDPEPEYSRLDRLDGLGTQLTNIQVLGRDRYAQCDETCTADCGACKGRRFGPYALPTRTRYDIQWPDVRAAETPGGDSDPTGPAWFGDLSPLQAKVNETWAHLSVAAAATGGDLAAMAAPADWPVWDYGEGYDIEPEERATYVHPADIGLAATLAADAYGRIKADCAEPHGRHRQTDPADLLLADLRDIEDRLS